MSRCADCCSLFQCFTHYYLGWRIVVTDPEEMEEAMDPMESGASRVLKLPMLFWLAFVVSRC